MLGVLDAVDNVSDGVEANWRAVAVSNDERAVAVAGDELIVCSDGVGLMQAVETTLGLIDIGLAQGGAEIFEAQAVRGQSGGIGLDAHGGALAATDADESDA